MNENPAAMLEYSWSDKSVLLPKVNRNESWLACLVILAVFFKKDLNFVELRSKFNFDDDELQTNKIVDIANQLGLVSRLVKIKIEKIQNLSSFPCILKLKENHYVVVYKIKNNKLFINDPVSSKKSLSLEELKSNFTGQILEITSANNIKLRKQKIKLKLSDFWSDISGLKRILTQIVFLSLLIQIFIVSAPFFSQNVVDHVLPKGDKNLLFILACSFILLIIFEMTLTAIRNLSIMHLSTKLNIQMSSNLFSHLIQLPVNFFQKAHMGDTLSRFDSLENVKQLLTTGSVTVLVDSAVVITTLIMMSIYSIKLTLIILGIAAIYLIIRLIIYTKIQELTKHGLEAHGEVATSFIESIRAIQSVKVFQKESQRHSLWVNKYVMAMNYDIRIARWRVVEETTHGLIYGIENILVIYFISTQVMENTLSMGMFFAFMSYKIIFVTSANSLISKAMEFRLVTTHLDRLSSIVFTPKDDFFKNYFPDRKSPAIEGHLKCDKISFKYENTEEYVIRDLSLDIKKGESVALIGPSGIGKTTLIKILMGLIQPTSGRVMVDGVNIMHHSRYRASIAAVLQEDELIYGTIAENISFFDEDEDVNFVSTCARNACIYEDVIKMPQGFNTLVGDVGASLSGGQIQRILLARALYRKPFILFLDEATSNLDGKTEGLVNENVQSLKITRIIIAHRKDTIESVDRIIDLEHLLQA